MMEKIINYCWFGRNEKPELCLKCIESWKKYAPDYKIIEWNEDNFDINICEYVKEAYENKKWAFVSDYVRFWVLYNYGGIYFDTDVELISSIDEVVEKGNFIGCEKDNECSDKICPAPGLGMGFEKNNDIIKDLIEYYNKISFVKNDGSFDYETVVDKYCNMLRKSGFDFLCEDIVNFNGVNYFSPEYFCPKNYDTGIITITKKTIAIHHYDGSWLSEEDRLLNHYRLILNKFLPVKLSYLLSSVISLLKIRGLKYTIEQSIKKIIK